MERVQNTGQTNPLDGLKGPIPGHVMMEGLVKESNRLRGLTQLERETGIVVDPTDARSVEVIFEFPKPRPEVGDIK